MGICGDSDGSSVIRFLASWILNQQETTQTHKFFPWKQPCLTSFTLTGKWHTQNFSLKITHMKKKVLAFFSVVALLASSTVITQADHHKKGEKKGLDHETMEKIMKVGFKGDKNKGADSLTKKVVTGKASKEESKLLLKWLLALESHKVEKGDQKEFNKKTDALVVAMAGVIAGKDGSVDALKKASNCKACHKAHKPD